MRPLLQVGLIAVMVGLTLPAAVHARSHVELDESHGPAAEANHERTLEHRRGDARAARLAAREQADDHRTRWRLAAGIGIRFGTFLVNNLDAVGTATQGHLDGGIRRGRLLLSAEYALMSITLPTRVRQPSDLVAADSGTGTWAGAPPRGLVHRAGAFARYSYSRVGARDAGADLWLEGGVGIQHLRWDAGGVWTRPDLALGLGASAWGLGRREHGGVSLGLRVTLAARNDVDAAPVACGGPCDRATTPTRWDRSFLFDLTFAFGR